MLFRKSFLPGRRHFHPIRSQRHPIQTDFDPDGIFPVLFDGFQGNIRQMEYIASFPFISIFPRAIGRGSPGQINMYSKRCNRSISPKDDTPKRTERTRFCGGLSRIHACKSSKRIRSRIDKFHKTPITAVTAVSVQQRTNILMVFSVPSGRPTKRKSSDKKRSGRPPTSCQVSPNPYTYADSHPPMTMDGLGLCPVCSYKVGDFNKKRHFFVSVNNLERL